LPRNEDGEFELLLGNRQLMSVFFIVVILLGVFFAMGYIVGRNSSPVAAPDIASRRPEPKSDVPSSSRDTASPTPAAAPKETAAPKENDAPKETASQQGPATPPAAAAPVTTAPLTSAPAKAPARVASSGQPESGKTYLQLSAIDHDAAEIMVELLRKKSFPAIAAEVPEKPGVFRVLVGPVADADLNKTRADLQSASFPGKEAIKRTF
jgi:cell division septation protein DedD